MRPAAAVKNGADHFSVEGAASLSTWHSVAHCCTLNALFYGLEDTSSEGLSFIREVGRRADGVDHLYAEGATYHSTAHSVAHCCTLNAGKSRLRGQLPTVQHTQRHSAAPSVPENQG